MSKNSLSVTKQETIKSKNDDVEIDLSDDPEDLKDLANRTGLTDKGMERRAKKRLDNKVTEDFVNFAANNSLPQNPIDEDMENDFFGV